jgi:aspartate racemase
MKTIGMIGGMSWESTAHYYRIINQEVRTRLGGLHSARCLMLSLDFSPIAALQKAGRWDALTQEMVDAAQALERGGADSIMICTNTMHLMAAQVAESVTIPLIHIVDPTAQTIKAQGIAKVGLLGTAFTMEQDFYKGRMHDHFGLDVVIPEVDDRATLHRVIYDELVQGRIEETSRAAMRGVIARLVEAGAQGIVLGCTELMLLIHPEDSAVPLFDTTELHAKAAVDFALSEMPRIRTYSDDLAASFHDINAQWIESMFVMEDTDRDVLLHPRERIIDRGGDILFVETADHGIIGTCALQKTGEGAYELTKMGVLETARGLKAGEFLLDAVIKRAGALGATKLYLLTNAKCAAAIHLYEKLGFRHDAEIMADYGARYERCNVAMRYVG